MRRLHGFSFLVSVLLSGCSLSSATRDPLLRIDLSQLNRKDLRSSWNEFSNSRWGFISNFFSPPATLAEFSCYGVNVTGPGISDSSRNPTPNPMIYFNATVSEGKSCTYRGVTTPVLTTAGGEVAMAVPPGPIRLVQVLGVDDVQICQSGVLEGVGTTAQTSGSTGKFFEIGRGVMSDFFSDRSLTINLSWPASTTGRMDRRMDCEESIPGTTPVSIDQVAVGKFSTCILVAGTVRCSGNNSNLQLGNGTSTASSVFGSILAPTVMGSVASIVAGSTLYCSLTANGGVFCWGSNANGELGNGTTVPSSVPTQVIGLSSGATSVSTDSGHSCAVVAGVVQCWGDNTDGQFGSSTPTSSTVPVVSTAFGSNVIQVTVGSSFTCALSSDGSVKCAGLNNLGQLGNGTVASSSTPSVVSGLSSGVTSLPLKFSGNHGCAILVTGELKCWGENTTGQLGNGTSGTHAVSPVSVLTPAGSHTTQVATGVEHTCAIVDGILNCWGSSGDGVLGTGGTNTIYTTPQVVGLSGVSSISASGTHSCSLVSGGLNCWGLNTVGAFGNGTTTNSVIPVSISL